MSQHLAEDSSRRKVFGQLHQNEGWVLAGAAAKKYNAMLRESSQTK